MLSTYHTIHLQYLNTKIIKSSQHLTAYPKQSTNYLISKNKQLVVMHICYYYYSATCLVTIKTQTSKIRAHFCKPSNFVCEPDKPSYSQHTSQRLSLIVVAVGIRKVVVRASLSKCLYTKSSFQLCCFLWCVINL